VKDPDGSAHAFNESRDVGEVTFDGFRSQQTECGGGFGGAGQRSNRVSFRNKALNQSPTDDAGSAGDKERHALASTFRTMCQKPDAYCHPEATATPAASHISHSSKNNGPHGSANRIMAKKIAPN